MSVFGGVMLFVAGVAIGAGAVSYNQYSIRRETKQLRREVEDLKTASWQDAMAYKQDKAYREGYEKGRRSPLTDVEQFADFLEEHKIDFRTQRKRGDRRGQENAG